MRSSVSCLLTIVLIKVYQSTGNNAPARSNSQSMSVLRQGFNFGDSEDAHLSSDPSPPSLGLSSNCPNYDVNKTVCSFEVSAERNGSDLAVMKAWTAVKLRDNIVSILGILLHTRNNIFPQDVYASLYLLYREVQRNNVKTMDLVPLLRTIAKSDRVRQLTMLFKVLEHAMPVYCKNAADNLARAFSKIKTNKLKSILSEINVDKSIELLRDIEPILEPLLRIKMDNGSYDKQLKESHGKEFAMFFAKITNGSVHLTQPVLAVLMLNLRYDEMGPEATEELRYLADILRNNKIDHWLPNVNVNEKNWKDPYDLVHASLTALSKTPELDEGVRNIVSRLLPKLGRLSSTSANPHYSDMKLYLGNVELNVTLLLDRLAEEVSTTETAILRDVIDRNEIDLNLALKDFIRYYYHTPQQLILALLNRIRNRVPISSSMQKTLKVLSTQVRLVGFRQGSAAMDRRKRNAENSKTVKVVRTSAELDPPSLRYFDKLRKSLIDLVNVLSRIDAHGEANNGSMAGFNGTTMCPNLSTSMTLATWLKNLNSSSTSVLSSALVKDVSAILGTVINDTEIILQVEPFVLQGANDTKRDQLVNVLRKLLTLKKVQSIPIVYYEVVRLYCILVHKPNDHLVTRLALDTTLEDPPPSTLPVDLIGNVSLPVATLLNDASFTKNLSTIKPENYPTKRTYLEALFKKMLALETIRNDTALFNEIVRLLRSIQSLRIRFHELTESLIIESAEETSWKIVVNDFLSRPNLLTLLGEDFDIGRYSTKGKMLRTILETALNSTIVKDDARLSTAIRKLIPKIDCSHRGAETVDSVHVNQTTSEYLNLYKLINGTIDRNKVSAEVESSFFDMYNTWYVGTFDLPSQMYKQNISLYKTRADLLAGFYDSLVRIVEEEAVKMKKDIGAMKSAILTTGTGAEPPDHI